MKNSTKTTIIILSGFLTFLFIPIFPVEGGGSSMIFLLTIPLIQVTALILGLVHYIASKNVDESRIRESIFYISLFITIGMTVMMYPYEQNYLGW